MLHERARGSQESKRQRTRRVGDLDIVHAGDDETGNSELGTEKGDRTGGSGLGCRAREEGRGTQPGNRARERKVFESGNVFSQRHDTTLHCDVFK